MTPGQQFLYVTELEDKRHEADILTVATSLASIPNHLQLTRNEIIANIIDSLRIDAHEADMLWRFHCDEISDKVFEITKRLRDKADLRKLLWLAISVAPLIYVINQII